MKPILLRQLAPASLVALFLCAAPAGATTTLSNTSGGRDNWNTSSNWNNGIPAGAEDAVVAAGIPAQVDNGSTPPYSGGLTLGTNASLQVGWTTNHAANANALGSGTITMNGGSSIISRSGLGTYTFNQPFVLAGDATIWSGISTTNHGSTKTLAGEISGPGKLTWNGVNRTWGIIDRANPSWTGGFETADPQNQRHRFRADADGCFGTGNVTIGNNCSFYISAGLGDTIADAAVFTVNGIRSTDAPTKLVLDSNETVLQFWLDGVQLGAGVYGSGSGLTDSNGDPLISGTGVLTVLENPGDGAFMLIATTDPLDGATDVRAGDVLTATFNKPPVLVSGNITLKNLTDGPASDVVLPVTDPRLSISGNVLTIAPGAGLAWDKDYAVRIDATAVESDTGIAFAGIADDTTWNFTSLPGDPFILALEALADHINGVALLTGPQIAAHKQTLDAERDRFDESVETISKAIAVVTAYDTVVGALWLPGSPVQSFDRTTVSDEDINWVVFCVMQHIMDEVYNAGVLADPLKRAEVDGFLFESVAEFPGAVSPPVNPLDTHTVSILAQFDDTFGRHTQQWTLPARKPTGTYLAPGTIATITVPASLVGKGFQVRVGAHSWDHEAKNRKPVRRLSRATIAYDIDATEVDIASPYGGGIYIEVPLGSAEGVVSVQVQGAVRSPYFSVKPFHTTTNAEWIATERNHPGPWADFQTEKFMMQVPTTWIFALDDPAELMRQWDESMDAINDLMGFPLIRGKETMYIQPDVILRSSVHAPGYPAVNQTYTYNPNTNYSGYHGNYMVRGPISGASTEFHEQGHAYFFPKFGGETEANVNLLYVPVLHRVFGLSLDESFRRSTNFPGAQVNPLDKTAVTWMTSFNFAPREQPMGSWEKAYQPQGHARWVDLARLWGWDGMGAYWRSFMQDDADGISYGTSTDDMLIRLCRAMGKDIRPLFHFWGIHPQDPAALAALVEAEGLTPPPEIYDLLQHYRTLIPADNAAYQAFCLDWYGGREPRITGYGVEREKTRQFDGTSYWVDGGWQYSGTADTNPDGTPVVDDGEIYTEASAERARVRLDALIALYFDDYQAWSNLFPPPYPNNPGGDLDDPDGDLDNDGLTNHEERVWGLDPTDNQSNQPVTVPFDGAGTLTYTRRDEALTGITYSVWYSTDMINWFEDTGASQVASAPDADGVESVAVALSASLMGADELFVRVRAED